MMINKQVKLWGKVAMDPVAIKLDNKETVTFAVRRADGLIGVGQFWKKLKARHMVVVKDEESMQKCLSSLKKGQRVSLMGSLSDLDYLPDSQGLPCVVIEGDKSFVEAIHVDAHL